MRPDYTLTIFNFHGELGGFMTKMSSHAAGGRLRPECVKFKTEFSISVAGVLGHIVLFNVVYPVSFRAGKSDVENIKLLKTLKSLISDFLVFRPENEKLIFNVLKFSLLSADSRTHRHKWQE